MTIPEPAELIRFAQRAHEVKVPNSRNEAGTDLIRFPSGGNFRKEV